MADSGHVTVKFCSCRYAGTSVCRCQRNSCEPESTQVRLCMPVCSKEQCRA